MSAFRYVACVLLLLAGGVVAWAQATGPQSKAPGDAESFYNAGQKALAAGDFDAARVDYERLSRVSPGIAEVHATLGAIYFQQKMFAQALASLLEARRLKPTLPKLDGLIAMSLSELGRFAEALPGLEQAFATASDAPVQRMSGLQLERAYTALHRDEDAVEVALKLGRMFPADPEILYHNERIFGNFAFVTVQKLGKVAPNSVWTHQALAEALESQGNHSGAIAEYRAVLRIDARRTNVHYRIGRALRAQSSEANNAADIRGAMAEFQEELRLDPGNANAEYEIGELHRLAGELDAAQTCFEAALKLYPEFPEANVGLATVLAARDRPGEALPYLKKAIAEDPSDEASWYRLSLVERALGHVDQQKQALLEFHKLHDRAATEGAISPRDVERQVVQDPME